MSRHRIVPALATATAALAAGLLCSSAAAAPGAAVAGPGRLLERIVVSNKRLQAVTSRSALDAGAVYTIVARGVVSDWTARADGVYSGEAFGVDALYCYAKWRCGTTPQLWRQLQVNGKGLDELAERRAHAQGILASRDQDELVTGRVVVAGVAPGSLPYARSHAYTVSFTGVGGALSLVAADAPGSASDNTGSFSVELYLTAPAPSPAATGSAAMRGVVSLASVSNGCGGGEAGTAERVGDTSTFRETNSLSSPKFTVSFRMACNVHDAGYSGAKVLDPLTGRVTDFRTWTRDQVDARFLEDMRALCEQQIPASAPTARADCRATGGKTSFGAETRFNFVRRFGGLFFKERVALSGSWTPAGGGSPWTIAESERLVTADWKPRDDLGTLAGAFTLTLKDGKLTATAPGEGTVKLTRG